MIDESSTGADSPPLPEAGWYPDPVRRAAYRYWNGREWTANTRGPATRGGSGGTGPGPAPLPAHGRPSFGEPARALSTSVSTSVVLDPVAVDPVVVDPVVVDPVEPRTEPGSRAGVPFLLIVAVAVIAFVGGLVVGRMVLADDGVTSSTSSLPRLSPPASSAPSADAPVPPSTAGVPDGSSEIDRLGTLLAEAERQRDEAASALATSQAEAAAAGARVANLETHVDALRSWFTAEVLDRAQAAFDGEVERACRAADEPTMFNTVHTRNMEPAGTHADLVASALACRSGG